MKFKDIEEAQDINSIKVDELVGSLLTFEMDVNEKNENKNKGVSFKSDVESDKEKEVEDNYDNFSNSIELIAKNLEKL